MTQGLTVELGARSYPIHFSGNATAAIQQILAEASKQRRPCVLLTDEGVAKAQARFLDEAFGKLPRLTMAAGEKTKSLENFGRVQDFLAANKVTRGGILWVVGGGVIGDLGGFSAA